MMIARGLEAADHLDAAWSRYEEAIGLDPGIDEAHEGLARVHERAGRLDEAIDALEHWSRSSEQAGTRALAALRAAEHAMAGEDARRAIDALERATREDPTLTPAWVLLCELVEQRDGEGEARRTCDAALAAIEPSALAVPIYVRAARLAEVASDRDRAIAYYGEAVRWDPRATDAALSQSRLIRAAGDWEEADRVLSAFVASHPDAKSPALAHVHLERGRLLSGPLERFEDSIAEYESALALQPDLGVARTALAGLLQHAPDRWRDALALHREILAASPTTTPSIRGLVRIAEALEQTETAEAALTVLRALGEASPPEADSAATRLRLQIQHGPPMADADAECWRRIAHQLGEELESVLADVPRPAPECPDPDVAEAIGRILDVEDELTGPRITSLDDEARAAFFADVAALFSDAGGDAARSPYAEALERSIGRWSRRKVRRILEEMTPDAVASHDPTAWLCELRAMAAAQALDRHGGDLRSMLRALLLLEADATAPDFDAAEIGTLVSTSETARILLSHITNMLCDRLSHGR
jgi:tetratricopeptide (TPR) repeat protein